ncbi:MAG: 30S ribosomal protein S8 [Patescibacteria group bacterium]|nr:30S ribosomal protein S8 [Patescibacteria group bacterium]MDE2437821.1 30S ribosomal protein S8 [Patescibacteria group bacterium]
MMNPFFEMMVKIKNGSLVKKDVVKVSVSKLNARVADILVREGYLEAVAKKGRGIKKYLELKLKYPEGTPCIHQITFVSKPGKRVYRGAKEIGRVRNGYGLSLISTSHGIITDKEAREKNIGGEVLLKIY